MDCSPPGSSVLGILQARILQWVAIPFSRGSSPPWGRTQGSRIAGRFFTVWVTKEAPRTKKIGGIPPTPSSAWWKHQPRLVEPRTQAPSSPSSGSGTAISPQEDQVTSIAHPLSFRLQMLYSRHNKLRVLKLNPLGPTSLVGRDSMLGEASWKDHSLFPHSAYCLSSKGVFLRKVDQCSQALEQWHKGSTQGERQAIRAESF